MQKPIQMLDTQQLKASPLPVVKIIKEARNFLFKQIPTFWVYVVILCLFSFFISRAENYFLLPTLRDFPLPMKSMIGVKTMIGGLGQGLVFTLLAIPCHRMILLEEKFDLLTDFNGWSQRETWFLIWAFLLFDVVFLIYIFIPVLSVILLNTELFAVLLNLKTEWPISIISILSIYVAGIPLSMTLLLLYVVNRVILVLPATAIDENPMLSWAWHRSLGNGWRLTLLSLLPIVSVSCLAGAGKNLMDAMPPSLFLIPEFLGSALYVIWGTLEVVLLSVAYRELRSSD